MSLVNLICKSFVFAFILGFTHVSIAQAADAASVGFGTGIMLSVVYGLISIILLMIGYKIFEWITPFSVSDALSKDQNLGVGISVGAIFIAIAIILAAVL